MSTPVEFQDPGLAARMGAAAGALGALARLVITLHAGERRPLVLALDCALGAVLGWIAAGLLDLIVSDPSPLAMAGVAGAAAVLGTRCLDLLNEWAKSKIGLPPR